MAYSVRRSRIFIIIIKKITRYIITKKNGFEASKNLVRYENNFVWTIKRTM